jgi:alkylation response protein AidB-like acyl-CoA dehydrogenase
LGAAVTAATLVPTTAPDSDEEAAVRATVREIARRCREHRGAEGDDHSACWAALDGAGFTELRAPDADGAPTADTTMTAIVAEELAGAVCGAPLLGTLLAAELRRLLGAEAGQQATTVLLRSDLTSLSADGAGLAWDASAPAARALALRDGELAEVPLAEPEPTQDLSRPVARPTGAVTPLGVRPDVAALARFDSFARILLAADLLGAAEGIVADAVGYVGQRMQFGVPVGSFQAVQHLAARAYVDLEAIRSAVLFGAWSLDAGREHMVPALVAKAYAGGAGVRAVEAAVQMFGGVAITWEFHAHRHLRRALLDARVFGSPDYCGEALAALAERAGAEEA